jgi:sarcosine oxidase / L-pipecolate oxidase
MYATLFADSDCRFLANAGKYIVNTLNGKSNGEEKDAAWAWKERGWDVRQQSPETPKLGAWTPRRELRDLGGRSKL